MLRKIAASALLVPFLFLSAAPAERPPESVALRSEKR